MKQVLKITDIASGKELKMWATSYPYYCDECFYFYGNYKCSIHKMSDNNKPCKGKCVIFKEVPLKKKK